MFRPLRMTHHATPNSSAKYPSTTSQSTEAMAAGVYPGTRPIPNAGLILPAGASYDLAL